MDTDTLNSPQSIDAEFSLVPAPAGDYTLNPFEVVVDTREQAPYTFTGIRTDPSSTRGKRSIPLVVPTVTATLKSGDYSIRGYETDVAIERKSLQDLFGTLAQRRKQFTAELERLNEMRFAAVVVEAGWPTILGGPVTLIGDGPHHRSQLNPKTVYRSVIAWNVRYERVRWWMCDSRAFAERTTFRILERWYKDNASRNKNP